MNKRKRIGRMALCLIVSFVMVMTLIPRMPSNLTYAAAGDVPDHDKVLTVNDDGTYKLALNVTGDSEKKIQKVNVLVIVDRSGSMNTQSGTGAYVPTTSTGTGLYGLVDGDYVALTRQGTSGNRTFWYQVGGQWVQYTGQRYQYDSTATRLQATQGAVSNLADNLLGYNGKDGNPNDTVEMALVTFATSAQTSVSETTSATTYTNAVAGITVATGQAAGTNWEAALKQADTINFGDSDPTYVIFFSDGAPTFYGSTQGTGQEEEPNMANSYNAATDDAAALAQKVGVKNFYTIFAYGTNAGRTYMTNLTAAAGAPAENNYSASSTAELRDAFDAILESIEMSGIGAVSMTDGTTSSVTTTTGEISNLLTVDTTSYKYYRAGGTNDDGTQKYSTTANDGLGDEWTGAPTATFENGAVKWDLSSEGVLENDVTYTVTFDCWPSQTTLDIVADIKNNPSSYDSLDTNIKKYIDRDGNLKTNTTATLSYTDTRNGQSGSSEYVNPDPVETTAVEQLAITKTWENELDGQKAEPITLTVTSDGNPHHTMTLSNDNNWTSSTYISIGIMRTNGNDVEVLETGHNFTFTEPTELGYYWELEVPTVRPMLVDGTLTMLILKDADHNNPDGAKEYTIDGKTYYVGGTGTASLTAVNHRRARLNLTKVVDGEDADPEQTFPFTLKVVNSKASEGSASNLNSDYYVWLSVYNGGYVDAVTSGATKEMKDGAWTGYYYAPSGSNISVNLKEGDNLRFLNLPSGSTYTFTEGTLPDNYAFTSSVLSGGEDSTFSGAQTTTGTIESTNTDYTVTYTNTYDLSDVEITKVWVDADDQDGIRPTPEEFKTYLTLKADGTDVTAANADKLTVVKDAEDSNKYIVKWTGLDRYAGGKEITYTVEESTIEGYTTTGSPANDKGTITNTHTPSKTEISVIKEWDDANNQDGVRPSSVSVTLKADGTAVGNAVTLDASNEWSYTWTDLDEFKAGQPIAYTVEEAAVDKYTTNYDFDDETSTWTVTNSYTPQETSYTITKAWNDNEDQDGVRPTSLSVQLYADDEAYGEPVELTADSDTAWSYTWSNLPKYNQGTEVTYTAKELDASGVAVEEGGAYDDNYTAAYINSTDTSITVRNTHNVEKTQYSVTKVWDDAENQDGIRPGSISVTLLADGEEADVEDATVELTADDNWTYTWTNLDKKSSGQDIDYSVAEISEITGYTTDGPVESEDGLSATITNTHETEKSNYTVTKVWVDADDQDGVRPESVSVQLYADDVAYGEPVELTADSETAWSYTWTDLPVNKDGVEIVYTAYELNADGDVVEDGDDYDDNYVASYPETTSSTSTTITNTHETLKTYHTVSKTWDDANDQDGIRPETLSVQLYADGEAYGDPVTIPAEDGTWTYTWNDLPARSGGVDIVYTADETAVPDGYTKTVNNDDPTITVITNSHTPKVISIKVIKVWDDEDDQDGVRPDSVTVNLLQGSTTYESKVLDANNNWQYTWSNLPEFADGNKINYSVTEDTVAGYDTTIGDMTEDADVENGYKVEVTNTHDVEKTTVTVTKVWDDNDDQDGIRPESISVTLLANEEEADVEDATVELTADDDWTYTWTNLDVNAGGEPIEYTVDEVEVEGYETEIDDITGDAETGFEVEITNTHEVYKTTVTVTKVWDDNNDQDGIRPDSISVTLLANEEEADVEDATVELTADNDWTYTWTDLDVNAGGEPIEYTVDEVEVEGYETEIDDITGDAETGFEVEITNTHEVYKTTVTVTKVWEDNDNAYDSREDVTVTLLADGEEADVEDAEAELNDDNEWTYTWENLDVNKEGVPIEYNVDELEIEGYTSEVGEVTGDAENGFEVIVTNTINNYDVTVTKTFEGIPAELIPADFSIVVSWGEAATEKAELKPAEARVSEDKLVYTWTIKAPYNAEITVEEINADVTGFILQEPEEEPTVTVTTGTNTLPIINTYEPNLGDLKITKNLKSFAETEGKTTFVFKVVAKLGTVEVYNDVVSIDFTAAGTDSYLILDKINVGANVTVEEIYTNGSYEPEGATVWTGVIGPKTDEEGVALDPVEAIFTNKYNNNLNQGYGILNEYSKAEGADWTHNGSQGKEEGKD